MFLFFIFSLFIWYLFSYWLFGRHFAKLFVLSGFFLIYHFFFMEFWSLDLEFLMFHGIYRRFVYTLNTSSIQKHHITTSDLLSIKKRLGFELAIVNEPFGSPSFKANNHLNLKDVTSNFNATATHKGTVQENSVTLYTQLVSFFDFQGFNRSQYQVPRDSYIRTRPLYGYFRDSLDRYHLEVWCYFNRLQRDHPLKYAQLENESYNILSNPLQPLEQKVLLFQSNLLKKISINYSHTFDNDSRNYFFYKQVELANKLKLFPSFSPSPSSSSLLMLESPKSSSGSLLPSTVYDFLKNL